MKLSGPKFFSSKPEAIDLTEQHQPRKKDHENNPILRQFRITSRDALDAATIKSFNAH